MAQPDASGALVAVPANTRGTAANRWPRTVEISLGLTIIVTLLAINLLPNGPFEAVREWLFDTYQQIWPAERNGSRTVLVEIDDESIHHIGQWPWPRDKVAALVQAVRDASAIGIDILMPEADRLAPENIAQTLSAGTPELRLALLKLPDPDAVLAAVMRPLPAVLAISADATPGGDPPDPAIPTLVRERGDGERPALPSAAGVRWPTAVLARAAHGMGVVSAGRGGNSEINEIPSVLEIGETILPSFALQLLAVAENRQGIVLTTCPAGVLSVSAGDATIRTGRTGGIRPSFVGSARLTRISAHRLLEPGADLSLIHGSIVIIGVTARGIAETFRTPLKSAQTGAEIQTELVESLVAGDTLWRPFWAGFVEAGEAAGVALATILVLGRISWRIHLSVFGLTVALLIASSVLLFREYRVLWDWTFPVRCMLITSFVALLTRIQREIAIRRQRDAELAVARVQQAAAYREAELRSKADRLQQSLDFAVDAARLGVWDADLRQGTWVHSDLHDAILNLTDPPPAWTTAVLLDRVVPEDLAATQSQLSAAQSSGTLQLECGIRWQDGSLHYIHVQGRFWRDADDNLSRVAGVVGEITQQRFLERRLRQHEKMQAVGLLAGGVAHNFNNLLTVVLGSLELASRKVGDSSGVGELISGAISASRKCADIARHLLAFARLQPLQPTTVDPVTLLRTICQMIVRALPDRVRLQLHTPRRLGEVQLDSVEFELALLNLAINARDAMPHGGRIDINARLERMHDSRRGLNGRYLVVEVADTGVGITPEILPNVFEPFFTTKAVGKGTGLGLSQVHGFAHQSGGAVEIDSTPGQGTRVRLYLPTDDASTATTQPLAADVLK